MKITVSGTTNSGKTTIAQLIEEALRKAGFEVNNLDPDEQATPPELQETRVRALASRGLRIPIFVEQVREEDERDDLISQYSDMYKDRYRHRPIGGGTRVSTDELRRMVEDLSKIPLSDDDD